MSAMLDMMRLMSIPTSTYDAVCRTGDGYYLARPVGSVGYDAFLGKPSPLHDGPGREWMLATWEGLSQDQRVAVYALAANPLDGLPILLSEFGVPKLGECAKC